jgi:hypothetical protein
VSRRPLWISALVFALLLVVVRFALRPEVDVSEERYFALKRRVPDTLVVATGPDTTWLVPEGETGWQVIRPADYRADPLVVEAMLKRLNDLRVDRVFPLTPNKLDTYGIRFPRGIIRALYRDLPPDTILIGAFTPNDLYDYVRIDSRDEVAVYDARLARTFLLKRTMDLRDTRLMPFQESRCVVFQLLDGASREPRLELTRGSDGAWSVTLPWPGPADPRPVHNFVESVAHTHVHRFITEGDVDPARFGLDRPRSGARAITDAGDTLEVWLGGPVPDDEKYVYAMTNRESHVLGVSKKYVSVLDTPGTTFYLPVQFRFGLADVDSVVVSSPRSGRSDLGLRGLPREVRDVLGNWVGMEATAFARATPAGLDRFELAPPRRGSLGWYGNGRLLARVDVGGVEEGRLALRVAAGLYAREGEILLVPEGAAAPLWDFLARGRSAP